MDERTRPTVGVVTPDLLGASSGLEFLRGIIDGKYPVTPYRRERPPAGARNDDVPGL
jgi:hypothetical protein